MKKIFITGGGGYCGSQLVPFLLKEGFHITIYDTFFFGHDHLPINNYLKLIKGDIRDIDKVENAIDDNEIFLHLACISNDTSFALNEKLSTTINFDAFEPLVVTAKKKKIKRFIYASSSSVYGVSNEKDVTEDHPLKPLTLYNKYKGMCEPLLFNHTDESFQGVIFRPATVCGYAPRLRLDLSVNILTNHAISKNKITVFGGTQLRPNLHVMDYCRVVLCLINAKKENINNNIFNVGAENLSINDIALKVKSVVEREFPEKKNIEIENTVSDDLRSYHINSDKILKELKFKTQFSVDDAVMDLCNAFKKGLIKNSFENSNFYNVRKLKEINAI
jgi:nucleoside-diphosphate-sugar epimerase|tara:strand:- start:769 stop:1767 length:999 start_codon:yes stop_codon:yes gene_type:complete